MLEKALDTLVEGLLHSGVNAPRNAVVSIHAPDKGFTYTKAVGQARPDTGQEMSNSHCFHWASVAKTATAVLILQLWEEGRFGAAGLDVPLLDVAGLPETMVRKLHLFRGVEQGQLISVRHLLQHSSGMKDAMEDSATPEDTVTAGLASSSLLGQWFFAPENCASAPRPMVPWDAAAAGERFAGVLNFYCHEDAYAKTALFPPGAEFHYSDTGFVLLGLVIEAITGKPLHQNLQDRVFKPLALDTIYLAYRSDPQLGLSRAPEAELYFGEQACFSSGMDLSFDWGGGGIVSTASSMNFFLQGLLSGKLFKRAETLQTMLDWQVLTGLATPRTGVGTGIFRTEYPHGELWGHAGAWGAKMVCDPEANIFFAGTINQAMGEPNWHWPFFEILKKTWDEHNE